MPTFKDEAICLRLLDWSETSQIAVLLTREHGKRSATAKGAKRRSPSTMARFSGGLEILTRGESVLVDKPSAELANLIEWNLLDAHWHLRRDLDAYYRAMYAADLVHHFVSDHDPHPITFDALADFLPELTSPDAQPAALLRFQWRLIEDMGYRPILDRDAQTGAPLDETVETLAFSPLASGLVHDTGQPDRWRVRRQTVQVLHDLASDQALNQYPAEALDRANRLLCAYCRSILDRHLPTMDYILGSERGV